MFSRSETEFLRIRLYCLDSGVFTNMNNDQVASVTRVFDEVVLWYVELMNFFS